MHTLKSVSCGPRAGSCLRLSERGTCVSYMWRDALLHTADYARMWLGTTQVYDGGSGVGIPYIDGCIQSELVAKSIHQVQLYTTITSARSVLHYFS